MDSPGAEGMDKREGGRSGVLLFVGMLLVGVVSGVLYFFTAGDPAALPPEPGETSGEGAPAGEEPSPLESYGWGEVVLEVERGEDAISVYFVNEGRVAFADVALSCVERYRKEFDGVACYGFPSEEAFSVAEVDPVDGGMKKKCWQAYYSVSGRGKDELESAGAIDNGQAGDEGCPTT
ncbi:MAG: hypothetical protein H0U53_09535 [Actinobacteria bacterium]|nr:hypothetical protein [Actinomycetota bacterium]